MWKPIIYCGEGWFQSALNLVLFLRKSIYYIIAQACFQNWGQMGVDLLALSHNNQCQCHHALENPLNRGALELNAFNIFGHIR